jgi:hypothetical protein
VRQLVGTETLISGTIGVGVKKGVAVSVGVGVDVSVNVSVGGSGVNVSVGSCVGGSGVNVAVDSCVGGDKVCDKATRVNSATTVCAALVLIALGSSSAMLGKAQAKTTTDKMTIVKETR